MAVITQDPQNLYGVLGLKPGASIEEVKKAYIKQQRECHPDSPIFKAALRKCKNNEERAKVEKAFKEKSVRCNQAKAILFDERKKQEYDSGISDGEFSCFTDGSEILRFFTKVTRASRRSQVKKMDDTKLELSISFEESYTGKNVSIKIRVQRECAKCKGKGGDNSEVCGPCKGRGSVEYHMRSGPILSIDESPCTYCKSTGRIVKGKTCGDCYGNQYLEVVEQLNLSIEHGIKNKMKYTFPGKGNHKRNYIPGDVILIINILSNPKFRRSNNNVIAKADIPLYTALVGGSFLFDHVDGKKLEISLKRFSDLKKCIIVRGEGFKSSSNNSYGDLIINPNFTVGEIDKEKLAEALNYFSTRGDSNGVLPAIQKQSIFGNLPEEERQDKASSHENNSEGFMKGDLGDLGGNLGDLRNLRDLFNSFYYS